MHRAARRKRLVREKAEKSAAKKAAAANISWMSCTKACAGACPLFGPHGAIRVAAPHQTPEERAKMPGAGGGGAKKVDDEEVTKPTQ